MTDYFNLLGVPRLPWLETDSLKSRFHSLSSAAHPDRVHGSSEAEKLAANQRYAELNAAYTCLREPKDRLLHLIELELGSKPKDVQRIPPGTMDLFVEVGQICREVDSFLGEKAKATSPLLQVQFFKQGMDWIDRLNALQQRVNAQRDELTGELKAMNAPFAAPQPTSSPERRASLPLERLEQIYRVFSYVSRWTEQIGERLVLLST